MDVANAILGSCKLHLGIVTNCETKESEDANCFLASKGFVRSLATSNDSDYQEKSFNDPGSFLWFYHKDMLEKAIQNESNPTNI